MFIVRHKHMLVRFMGEEDQNAVGHHVDMAEDLQCFKPASDAVVDLGLLPVHTSHVVHLGPDLEMVTDHTE